MSMEELLIPSIIVKLNGGFFWKESLSNCPNTFESMTSTLQLSDAEMDNLDLSHPDQILNTLYSLESPVYITGMDEEQTLFYNPAVQQALSHASDERIRNCSLALNYPDELRHRNDLIKKDKNIPNYEFKALRWVKDGEIWRRREMEFVSNFAFCEYLGIPARVCIHKNATPLTKIF
ncbi:MAG: hypothetical protein AAGA60_30220 [Cyanobacteria bacterium P01_E01_bin.42]